MNVPKIAIIPYIPGAKTAIEAVSIQRRSMAVSRFPTFTGENSRFREAGRLLFHFELAQFFQDAVSYTHLDVYKRQLLLFCQTIIGALQRSFCIVSINYVRKQWVGAE